MGGVLCVGYVCLMDIFGSMFFVWSGCFVVGFGFVCRCGCGFLF